jgi:anti-sigma B factor antagonist
VAEGDHLRVGVQDHGGGTVVVRLDGELDLTSAPLLEGEFDNPLVSGANRVVLELSGLEFIDSTGLRAIFNALARSRERAQEFAVTRGSEQVQRLLSITRVGEHLPIVDSPEQPLS